MPPRFVGPAIVIVACGLSCSPPAPAPRPNVVVITLDTTRADHLGCYGRRPTPSPRIDEFAQTAFLFANAASASAITPVSHATLFTGLYPYHHGARVIHGNHNFYLDGAQTTLAERFRDAGYETAAFISAFPAGKRYGLEQGFETFEDAFLVEPLAAIVSPEGRVTTGRNQRHAGETTAGALAWLERRERPFLLWLHYFDPHDMFVTPPPAELATIRPTTDAATWDGADGVERRRIVYERELQYMDAQIGRVLDALNRTGHAAETIVVIISDHGEGLGDHAWWGHDLLYQEQIHVPFLIRVPGRTVGRRVEPLVRSVDLLPTLLELVGLEPGAAVDGQSLVPLFVEGAPDPGYIAYADSMQRGQDSFAPEVWPDISTEFLFSLSDGRWKYIHHMLRDDRSELYDLAADPGELSNVFGLHPQEVERFRRDLVARDPMPRADGAAGVEMSQDDIDHLRALGYLR